MVKLDMVIWCWNLYQVFSNTTRSSSSRLFVGLLDNIRQHDHWYININRLCPGVFISGMASCMSTGTIHFASPAYNQFFIWTFISLLRGWRVAKILRNAYPMTAYTVLKLSLICRCVTKHQAIARTSHRGNVTAQYRKLKMKFKTAMLFYYISITLILFK